MIFFCCWLKFNLNAIYQIVLMLIARASHHTSKLCKYTRKSVRYFSYCSLCIVVAARLEDHFLVSVLSFFHRKIVFIALGPCRLEEVTPVSYQFATFWYINIKWIIRLFLGKGKPIRQTTNRTEDRDIASSITRSTMTCLSLVILASCIATRRNMPLPILAATWSPGWATKSY